MNIFSLLFFTACSDVEEKHDHDHDHEHEVMTTITLTFTSQADGSTSEFTWADPESDGDPVIDDITLLDADDYNVAITIFNELEDPAEEITPEIADEEDEHQFFFTGPAVVGPATLENADAVIEHAYDDQDADGLPIGLRNKIKTLATGSSELTVTLRHMPLEDGNPVKVEGLADTVANDGFESIGGANDFAITFPITVE